jgi:hypothetical protein
MEEAHHDISCYYGEYPSFLRKDFKKTTAHQCVWFNCFEIFYDSWNVKIIEDNSKYPYDVDIWLYDYSFNTMKSGKRYAHIKYESKWALEDGKGFSPMCTVKEFMKKLEGYVSEYTEEEYKQIRGIK